jgi:transketolase
MKITEKTSMRDALFGTLYERAKKDKDIVVVTADMGAPSLDQFREEFPERFFNVGIAEHNMIAVASGLASEGKNVYTFAIAPFITSRCFEFTKLIKDS